jgi:quercetin dioxygenase-like cupin family protein
MSTAAQGSIRNTGRAEVPSPDPYGISLGNRTHSRHVDGTAMSFRIVRAEQLAWDEYERYPGRFRAELTEAAGLRHTRANLIRHEPRSVGPRHAERAQDETFVPLRGTLTMYLGEPPERHEVTVGGLVHVEAGTALQIVNETDQEVVVFVCGAPPEPAGADMFDSAV